MPRAENVVKGSYRNIVDAYHSASPASHAEGTRWYTDAHGIAKQISGMLDSDDIRVGAGIIAALSPQMEWGDNVSEAVLFCSTGYSTRQTQANNDKAILIAQGQDPEEKPVVDRHAIWIYYGKPVTERQLNSVFGRKKVMRRIQSAYIRAGREIGQHYNVVQSTTWIQHRKNKGIVKETAWSG